MGPYNTDPTVGANDGFLPQGILEINDFGMYQQLRLSGQLKIKDWIDLSDFVGVPTDEIFVYADGDDIIVWWYTSEK